MAAHVRVPLYQNSYALVAGTAATAVLGLAYWTLAARLYPAADVGIQSATVSAMLFLAGLAQLSLNNVLLMFAPRAGARTGRLVAGTYVASLVAAAVAAIVFVGGTPLWSPKLAFLLHDRVWTVAFVAATGAWCMFSLQDSVLLALRQALWVPLENVAVSVVKIALLVAFSFKVVGAALFASWTIPAAAAVAVVNWFVFRRVVPALSAPGGETGEHLNVRTIGRFVSGNYVGFILYAASANLVPLIVLGRAGSAQAAYFFVPWTITTALAAVGASTASSLTVEAVRDLSRLAAYVRRTLVHTLVILSGPVAVLGIGAPMLLRAFGRDYADNGTTTLRLLVLGVLPNAMVLVAFAVLRLHGRVWRLAAIQAVACAILLGVSFLLLPGHGIAGVGLAYLASQLVAAGLVLATDLGRVLRSGTATA